MLNGRIYRAAFLPLLLAIGVGAFSLTNRSAPITSSFVPDAFDGAWTLGELKQLAQRFPDRRPGSQGDQALAGQIAQTIEGQGGLVSAGFHVSTRHFDGQTIDGKRSLATVIAQRPGGTGKSPIVIVAHRDAAAHGSQAELSATAVLLELARVFSNRETERTIVLVSTSGGSGGDAGAADFIAHASGPDDAAIVLGDLASEHARKPFVISDSDGLGSAPDQLQSTVGAAITAEVGTSPGASSVVSQFVHLAVPLATGEQGVLNAGGLSAVLVQTSAQKGPSAREPVSEGRLENFGRAVLSAVDALDSGRDISPGPQAALLLNRKVIPGWAIRLLLGALMVPSLLVTVDTLARVRRRREPIGQWMLWTLACAAPFFLCALLIMALGKLGIVAAPSPALVSAQAIAVNGSARLALGAVISILGLMWLFFPRFVRVLGVHGRPDSAAVGVSVLIVLDLLALVVWARNPFTALLIVPALHLWLLVVSPDLRPARGFALGLVGLALLPVVLLIVFYAHEFGLSPLATAWAAMLFLAGGNVGILPAALWSLSLGCVVGAALVAFTGRMMAGEHPAVTVRGPISYAGPGSLGGTKSALRR
jgi:Peptidase family M28